MIHKYFYKKFVIVTDFKSENRLVQSPDAYMTLISKCLDEFLIREIVRDESDRRFTNRPSNYQDLRAFFAAMFFFKDLNSLKLTKEQESVARNLHIIKDKYS